MALERDSLLANIPVGYSDGYRRILSNNASVLIKETLNNSSSQARIAVRDELLGANRSNSGAIARICNDTDRPNPQFPAARRIVQRFLNGKRAPMVGTISMNTFMVDVTDIPRVKTGDEVVLFGKQGDAEITQKELEDIIGVFLAENYTVWSTANPRVLKYKR